jgi:hypothetical protein
MLVTDLPDSIGNLWPMAMGPTLLQSPKEKDKQKKLKLGLKYLYCNVHCTFVLLGFLIF